MKKDVLGTHRSSCEEPPRGRLLRSLGPAAVGFDPWERVGSEGEGRHAPARSSAPSSPPAAAGDSASAAGPFRHNPHHGAICVMIDIGRGETIPLANAYKPASETLAPRPVGLPYCVGLPPFIVAETYFEASKAFLTYPLGGLPPAVWRPPLNLPS